MLAAKETFMNGRGFCVIQTCDVSGIRENAFNHAQFRTNQGCLLRRKLLQPARNQLGVACGLAFKRIIESGVNPLLFCRMISYLVNERINIDINDSATVTEALSTPRLPRCALRIEEQFRPRRLQFRDQCRAILTSGCALPNLDNLAGTDIGVSAPLDDPETRVVGRRQGRRRSQTIALKCGDRRVDRHHLGRRQRFNGDGGEWRVSWPNHFYARMLDVWTKVLHRRWVVGQSTA